MLPSPRNSRSRTDTGSTYNFATENDIKVIVIRLAVLAPKSAKIPRNPEKIRICDNTFAAYCRLLQNYQFYHFLIFAVFDVPLRR